MSEMEQQRQEVTETSQPNRLFSVSLSNLPSRGPSNKTSFSLHPTSSSRSQKCRDVRDVHRYGDDGSDLEGEEERPIHEAVTGFDARAGGAIPADEATSDANGAKHELVIKVESKNNWRDRPGVNIYRPRSTKNLLPKEAQAQLLHANKGGQNSGAVKVEGPNMSYGLSFVQPQNIAAGEPTVPGEKQVNISDIPMADVDTEATSITGAVAEQRPLTQDEIALQALNNESRGQTGGRRSDLIIESSKQTMFEDQYEVRYDEMSSFRADVATRPDSASLDDYTAIPVEEFGAALLRGMGWKEGQPIGKGKYGDALKNTQPRIPERRPGFLGIGAKDISGSKGAEVEIGAWGKAAMRKSSGKNGDKDSGGNTDGIYMPVLMKSKKTGEFITEEEFKARRKEVKERNGEENWRERRDRNLEKSGRDWNRDRDYRRDNDRERAVHQGDEIDSVEGGMMRIVVGEMIAIIENTREIETGTGKGIGIGAELGTGIEVQRKIIETGHALGMKIGILGIHLPLLRGGTETEIEIAGIKMGIRTEVMDVVLTGERMITIVDCGNLDPFLLFLDRNEHKYLFLNRKPLLISTFPYGLLNIHGAILLLVTFP
ncbi:hypothetical protein Egran_04712 [Elaphomyces granulatus]|uniref:Pre-mRNA-splicing factor n=1 Tax=Elaphomyces granulatus TaxID=519963 RepID=A0A232LTT8_9EURO|nr:hypothetical protein Egran_04712 [Elaphomyces granulatus]